MPYNLEPVGMLEIKEAIAAIVQVYMPHWLTCSKANDFKKKEVGNDY